MADLEGAMQGILEILPSTNFTMASATERADTIESFARALMGLSHPIQLVGQTRSVAEVYEWPSPPRLTRRWLAVVSADEPIALEWRLRTLASTLEGIGLRTSESPDDYLSEPVAQVEPWCVNDGRGYCASLVLRRWPREVMPGWLGQALSGGLPVDVAIYIEPQDTARIARFLKRQQSWQEDGGRDAANELGRRDAETTRRKLIAHQDRPVKAAVVLTVRAETRDQLRQRVATLGHEMGLTLADVRLAKYEQDRGLKATLPTGQCNLLGAWRTLDCTSVASTWPFQPATINHANGADIGTTHDGSMLVRLDPFDPSLRSFGGLVTGSVGSGKSYFLKLLLRRLHGVELRIVEHSDPPEYGGVPGLLVHNIADLSDAERAVQLRTYIADLWALARRDPKPRLLVLDELWAVLRRSELAMLTEEVARRGRKYGLALWIATQQIEDLLANEWGKAVFDNVSVKVYLQQENRDIGELAASVHLPEPARRALRGASRGQALIDCGKMLVLVDIQASRAEHKLVTTDPREIWGVSSAAD